MFLEAILPKKRTSPGHLRIFDRKGGDLLLGPFAVLGKADSGAATRVGNRDRTPSRQNGDTPTGEFSWIIAPAGWIKRSFGPHRRIAMFGQSGDFAKRDKAARDRGHASAEIMIHGGDPAVDGKSLRPTHGCLRISDNNMLAVLTFLDEKGVNEGAGEILEGA